MFFRGRIGIQNRSAGAEGQFIDEQMIAYKEVVFHRRRGNLKSLNDEGGAEKCKDDGDHQRFEIFTRCGFFVYGFGHN